MKQNREWSAAATVWASTAGISFSTGRQVVLFFTQMGWASWIGIAFAASAFGLLCGMICHFALRTEEKSFSGIFARILDSRQSMVVSALHSLLMAFIAGMMIASTGSLAALTLPLRNAFWIGVLFSTGLALLLSMHRMKRLRFLGTLALLASAIFYFSLFLDSRPVRIPSRYETVPELSGNLSVALLLSVLHAAMNASIAGEAVACFASRPQRPMRLGLLCGAMMFALLSAVNAALIRGGDRLLSQELPTVILAARWGVFGYYASLMVMWLCSLSTLTAALASLASRMNDAAGSKGTVILTLFASAACSAVLGFEKYFESMSPTLACAAAFCFCGLICYCDMQKSPIHFQRLRNMTKKRVKLYKLPEKWLTNEEK